ncbi:hypothetical protein AS19_07740 [Alcanivorax sp. NBRC 101098]|nr:hypothetical protein AS19_07740 [Alcanivorax sp. NBRC 101098]
MAYRYVKKKVDIGETQAGITHHAKRRARDVLRDACCVLAEVTWQDIASGPTSSTVRRLRMPSVARSLPN